MALAHRRLMRVLAALALILVAGCASVDRTPCFTEASKSRASFELKRHLRLPPDQPLEPGVGHEVIVHCTQAAEGLSCRPLYPQNDTYDEAALVYARYLQLCPGTTGSVGFAVYVPEH